jgi:hypothetical protein
VDQVTGFDYPAFYESRFMAYDVIAHGAKGILYWGSQFIENPEFRTSLYALCAELSALNDFLVAPDTAGTTLTLVEAPDEIMIKGVRHFYRHVGDASLLVLVNEDNLRHMAVQVDGLNNGKYHLLYGDETVEVANGRLLTRMQPYEVKVFCTDRQYEAAMKDGRGFEE